MASAPALQLGDDGRSKGGGRRSSGPLPPPPPPPPPEEGLRCPRCDSPNTKFCYYNNYSLTQPRHYCKACRRYWTRGGALRNVPVGGGCRKNKKSKSSSSSSCSISSYSAPSSRLLPLDIKDPLSSYSSVDTTNPFKFFHGFSPDFHLGTGLLPYTRLSASTSTSTRGLLNNSDSDSHSHSHSHSHPVLSFGDLSITPSSNTSTSLMDINYPIGNYSESTMMRSSNTHSRFASTIEPMSSMDQDLHWKLQQQRLSMFYGGGEGGGANHQNQENTTNLSDLPTSSLTLQNIQRQPQHNISFQMEANMESLAAKSNVGTSTSDWYQANGGSRGTSENCTDVMNTWNDIHHFSALP